jgi:small subunit ribosomal protein S2
MPYVNQRWLGGMLTNFQTVNKRLQRLKELELIDFDDVAGSAFTKKELLIMRRERDKLAKTLGGIRDMTRVPSAVWIVDTNKEHLAVDEARKLGIPIVAILDTNCDPDVVDYKIPGNDDAIRAVSLLTRVIADAAAEGLIQRHSGRSGAAEGGADADAEPLAEWERELLAGAEAGLQSSPGVDTLTNPATTLVEPVTNAGAQTSEVPAEAVAAAEVAAEAAPGEGGQAEGAATPGQDAAPAVDAAVAAAAAEEPTVADPSTDSDAAAKSE